MMPALWGCVLALQPIANLIQGGYYGVMMPQRRMRRDGCAAAANQGSERANSYSLTQFASTYKAKRHDVGMRVCGGVEMSERRSSSRENARVALRMGLHAPGVGARQGGLALAPGGGGLGTNTMVPNFQKKIAKFSDSGRMIPALP